MNTNTKPTAGTPDGDALQAWVKKTMDEGVKDLMDRGVVDELLVEAKPAWILPHALLIGRIRGRGRTDAFDWFICGDGPTTHVQSAKAANPREAARHFALQWQLQAARLGGLAGEDLAKKAGALYELVEEEALWPEVMGSEK